MLAEVKSPPRAPNAFPIAPDRAVPDTVKLEYLKASAKSCACIKKDTSKAIVNRKKYFFMAFIFKIELKF
jgi:hypothetical protein